MKFRTRLIGAVLLMAAFTSIGEQLWATTCAPEGAMVGTDHSVMPGMEGMPGMSGMADHAEHPAQSQPTDNQSDGCPLDDGLIQACGWHMLTATAGAALPGATDHQVRSIPHTTVTPETADLSAVFHPPKS